MKSSMIFWLVSVLILSVAIECTKTMRPKDRQKDSAVISKMKIDKSVNTTLNQTEETTGKLGEAKERTIGNHNRGKKGKRVTPPLKNESPVARHSTPPVRTDSPNLRETSNPAARTEINPRLRAPSVFRVENTPVA